MPIIPNEIKISRHWVNRVMQKKKKIHKNTKATTGMPCSLSIKTICGKQIINYPSMLRLVIIIILVWTFHLNNSVYITSLASEYYHYLHVESVSSAHYSSCRVIQISNGSEQSVPLELPKCPTFLPCLFKYWAVTLSWLQWHYTRRHKSLYNYWPISAQLGNSMSDHKLHTWG